MKITKREMFNAIIKMMNGENATLPVTDGEPYVVTEEDVRNFCEHEIELLNNKRSGSGKPTKTQIENEKIKEKILEVLTDVNEVMTISELMTADGLENYSNQKLSVLCHQLVDEHKVVNTKVKKVSYFKIA